MTVFPDALAAHLDGTVTTVCHCWRLTRRDGVVLGFTDHDRPLTVDGTPCLPGSGLTASEARDRLGMAAETAEVEGALSSERIDPVDVVAGHYDGARVETLLVNWRDPESFARLRTATVGAVTRRDDRFVAELQSLTHQLDRANGRRIMGGCDAELGDRRCGVDVLSADYRATGVVAATDGREWLTVSGLDAYASGWFGQGRVTWTSGARDGLTDVVGGDRADGAGRRLTLLPRGGAAIEPGDGFVVTAGCDKAFGTCRAKFDNGINFRGFPHLPGNDRAYGYVSGGGGPFDGGPLVE